LERGCVEDQPQHARNVLRLTLRAQPRSDGMLTNQSSGEKCGSALLKKHRVECDERYFVGYAARDRRPGSIRPLAPLRLELSVAGTAALRKFARQEAGELKLLWCLELSQVNP